MKNKKLVTIGGGTGSFTLLSGLKKYPVDISAVVSMADDGGSTGVLRDELGVLPPGDVRQCLVALSESSEMLRKLLNYRFESGGLKGHNFGNLFLSALEKVSGSFGAATQEAMKILNVKGEILPVTNQDSHLFLRLKNGKILKGQNEINHNYLIEKVRISKMYFSPSVKANPQALRSIREADLIVIGPGNYYCSLLPNFLVQGISEAIKKSKAKVVLNCNLVNKKGHTENFTLDEYAQSLEEFIGPGRLNFVTFNTRKPEKRIIEKYRSQQELLVTFEPQRRLKRSFRVVQADLLSRKLARYSPSDAVANQRSLIRHDSNKLAELLIMLLELGKYENILKGIV